MKWNLLSVFVIRSFLRIWPSYPRTCFRIVNDTSEGTFFLLKKCVASYRRIFISGMRRSIVWPISFYLSIKVGGSLRAYDLLALLSRSRYIWIVSDVLEALYCVPNRSENLRKTNSVWTGPRFVWFIFFELSSIRGSRRSNL